MKRKSTILIVVLILMLAIGFAAVATTIILSSSTSVGQNSADFDVYFSSATTDEGGTATINQSTKREITFGTKTLKSPGDVATLNYTVTNNSSQYDADVSVTFSATNTVDNTDYTSYYSVTRTGFDTTAHTTVAGKTSVDGTVVITLLKPVTSNVQISFTLTLNVNATERTSVATTQAPAQLNQTCPGPGCKYYYYFSSDNGVSDFLSYGNPQVALTNEQYNSLQDNYENVDGGSGKTYFLGLIVNEDTHVVEKAYSCGIKDETLFCLEGTTNGSAHMHNKNNVLIPLYGIYENNTDGTGCLISTLASGSDYAECWYEYYNSVTDDYDGDINGYSVGNGQVAVWSYMDYKGCYIRNDNAFYCGIPE